MFYAHFFTGRDWKWTRARSGTKWITLELTKLVATTSLIRDAPISMKALQQKPLNWRIEVIAVRLV